MTTLIGRETEIAELSELIERPACRLVTITGPGGIGKTRLALEVARRVPQAAFVSLASVGNPELLMGAIETQLGIESRLGRTPVETLSLALLGSKVLLLLDNVEHLLDGVAGIEELLRACPDLIVLATSRIRLGLAGEHRIPLEPLELPVADRSPLFGAAPESASVQLFVERAQASHPAFALSQWNIDAVRHICRQLDGLPLAVELAAARSNILSPESLAARLERRLELLTGGPRDVPRRLQTMHAAIEWSYELLPEQERIFWERLAVFRGGFTADAAIAVGMCKDVEDLDPLTCLESLVGQSLLKSTSSGLGEARFIMLETTRVFALQQLEVRGHDYEARQAHARHFLSFTIEAEPFLMSSDPESWFSRIDTDLDNIRSALTWGRDTGEIQMALEIASHLAWFWTYPNYLREGLEWFETLLSRLSPEVTSEIRAHALLAAGDLATWLGEIPKAIRLQEEALGEWRRLNDSGKIGATLRSLGSAAIDLMQFDSAKRSLQEARVLAHDTGDAWNEAASMNLLGVIAEQRGNFGQAIDLCEGALRIWRQTGHQAHFSASLNQLGWSYLGAEDLPRAYESFDAALSSVAADEINETAMAIFGFATLASKSGSIETAIKLLAASVYYREVFGTALRPITTANLEKLQADLRTQVSESSFSLCWIAGQTMELAEAVALARTMPSPVAISHDLLTSRELDVLALLVEGTPDIDIADQLFITRRTASKYVASILDKLGAPNRTAAATIALRRSLL